jgi:chemotaxis protein MotB
MSGGHDGGLPEEHEEHANHEAWVIPYADLLTLLMAMFIALFAMSTVNIGKFKQLAIGFNQALNGPSLDKGVFATVSGDAALSAGGAGTGSSSNGGAVGIDTQPNTNSVIKQLADKHASLEAARSVEQQSLKQVEKQIQDSANHLGLGGKLGFRLEQDGLVVTVVTDQILFASGSAVLQPEGNALLDIVAKPLQSVANPIIVKGYTDSQPITGGPYPSNWALSGARAGAVAVSLENAGLDPARLTPEGLGERDPVASNATPEGRSQNRRVEIVVQSTLVNQALQDNNLTNKTVTTTTPKPVGSPISNPVQTNIKPDFTTK